MLKAIGQLLKQGKILLNLESLTESDLNLSRIQDCADPHSKTSEAIT